MVDYCCTQFVGTQLETVIEGSQPLIIETINLFQESEVNFYGKEQDGKCSQ